jgi:outer membrane protein
LIYQLDPQFVIFYTPRSNKQSLIADDLVAFDCWFHKDFLYVLQSAVNSDDFCSREKEGECMNQYQTRLYTITSLLIRITIILFLLNPTCLWAGEQLSLKDCFKAALKRSEALATQQELVVQAEENYHRAWGSILPAINGSYSYFYRNAPGLSSSGNTSNSTGQQTLKIMVDQPLFRGFSDFAAVKAAKAFITAQEQARQWAGMQLYRDVAQAFYTRLAVQKDLRVFESELEQYQKRIKELEERRAIGRSRTTEVLTVQAAQAILRAQREQVLGQLNVAKEVLAFLTGFDQDIPLDDTDEIPLTIGSLESYQSEISARPDIKAAQKNVEAFKSNVSVAKGAYLPSADFIGNYYVERPDRHQEGAWDVGITVTLPIFTGGIISSNVQIAESQKRQSEIQLSQVQRLALEDVRSLYHNLKADLAQLAALQEAFNIAKKNYEANVKDYKFNLVTNLDVLQALTAYQDTQRSLEKIRYLVKIDYNKLEAAVAHRLTFMEGQEKP